MLWIQHLMLGLKDCQKEGAKEYSRHAGIRLYQDRHYTWAEFCIKTALPQATVFSLGIVNWGVVYPTVFFLVDLGPL